jgi:hypothetical protein
LPTSVSAYGSDGSRIESVSTDIAP